MTEPKTKSDAIYVRVTPETKQKFTEAAEPFGTPSEVIRELILAFIEGRLTIAPPKDRKELYNARTEIE